MSSEKRRSESLRWYATAENDYEVACILKENKRYSTACFHAQQSAEKALKAVWYLLEEEPPWGHSISKLLYLFIEKYKNYEGLFSSLDSGAKRLDQFYIPTRYPNGIPDITPQEAYGEDDAMNGISIAEKFLIAAKSIIDEHK